MKSFQSTTLYRTCNLLFLINCMLTTSQWDSFTSKYGCDVHSYIARTETKKNKKTPHEKALCGTTKRHKRFCRLWRASNLHSRAHFILGGGFFGLLPNSILEGIGDSLPRTVDRYAYIVSIPNTYHIVGRGGVRRFAGRILARSMGRQALGGSYEGYSEKKETSRKMGESEAGIWFYWGDPI